MNIARKPETILQREQRLFIQGFIRLITAHLNAMFDLSSKASKRRALLFFIFFFIVGFLLTLIHYPLSLWLAHIQDIFLYTLSPESYRATYTTGDPLSVLFTFAWKVFSDPRNLRLIFLLLAPYFISLQFAAIYLSDIFNLDNVSIARRHIHEVALGGADEAIRISKGEIAEESKQSPNYLIGGPGKVIVELDSAALFEKPDGSVRIIGPTDKEPDGKATIEGFERFREAVDLRDQTIELRDLDEKDRAIYSRSRDGIPISATDVRFRFSVIRGEETSALPYSFNEQAIEHIVYKALSVVTPRQESRSKYTFLWPNNMITLIRSELAKFMGRNELNKYFASIGSPETRINARYEAELTNEVRNLLPLDVQPSGKNPAPAVSEFYPRSQIKEDLFGKFAASFNKIARDRGVQLDWINIGTWSSPVREIFGKHVDAWKIGQESAQLRSDDTLSNARTEAVLQKLSELIQDVPLGAYQQAKADSANQTAVKRALLDDFKKQLVQARDLWTSKGEIPPADVEEALDIIFKVVGGIFTESASAKQRARVDNDLDSSDNDEDAPLSIFG